MEAIMGSKVLLADDSVTIQKVVKIIFDNEDYELVIVGNGDAAIQKAREIMPDVMLVDALMPTRNGYEVCQEIRRDPSLQHISLLLMTGAFDVVDEEKKRQSGADDFITKPFESQSLLDVTARLIALSSERARKPAAPQQAAAAQPAAPQPVAAPPAAPPVSIQPETPAVDDIWGGDFSAGFDQEVSTATPEPFDTTIAPQVASAPAPVAAQKDDDLWGVFDSDAVDAATPVSSEPSATTISDDDFFDFSGEVPTAAAAEPVMEEFVLDEVADSEPVLEEPQRAAAGFDAFGEFDLEPSVPEPAPAPVMANAPSEEDFSSISFDEPEPVAPAAPPVVPAPSQAAPIIPEPAAAPPLPSATPSVAAVPLEEEQLKMLLSKVSRDVIEKIVWEIVPDLAESIIREEIRKLKEGIRG